MTDLEPIEVRLEKAVSCHHPRQKRVEDGKPMPCAARGCPEGVQGDCLVMVLLPGPGASFWVPQPEERPEAMKLMYKREAFCLRLEDGFPSLVDGKRRVDFWLWREHP